MNVFNIYGFFALPLYNVAVALLNTPPRSTTSHCWRLACFVSPCSLHVLADNSKQQHTRLQKTPPHYRPSGGKFTAWKIQGLIKTHSIDLQTITSDPAFNGTVYILTTGTERRTMTSAVYMMSASELLACVYKLYNVMNN